MFCWMDYTDFYVTVMDTRYIFCRSHVEYFTPRDVSTVSLLQIKPSAENITWNEKQLLYHLNLFEFKSFYGIDPVRRGLKSSWKFMGKIVDFQRKEREREQNSHFTGLLDVWCSKKWARNLIESLDFCLHTVNPYQTILFAIWKSHFSTWKDTQFMAFSKHIRNEVVGDESML